MSHYVFSQFGYYEITSRMMNREDAIELSNILRTAESPYLRELGIEIESELMELLPFQSQDS
jgi:hypothetical protein